MLALAPVAANAQVIPLATLPSNIDAQTRSLLFDSMLAIARSNIQSPMAATAASLSYQAAIQRLQSGDISGARRDAAYALGQLGLTSTTIPVGASAVDAIAAPLRALEHPILFVPFTDPRHDLRPHATGNPCASLSPGELRNECQRAVTLLK
jgi:hypothetical protein